ncbi:MAG: hypothetical protein LQ343_006171 [Gyalolechia ehrenbergii]|nr:MAG: hypothetical protein LQ343_006171 [Gyalolechia ehrenbergii]
MPSSEVAKDAEQLPLGRDVQSRPRAARQECQESQPPPRRGVLRGKRARPDLGSLGSIGIRLTEDLATEVEARLDLMTEARLGEYGQNEAKSTEIRGMIRLMQA